MIRSSKIGAPAHTLLSGMTGKNHPTDPTRAPRPAPRRPALPKELQASALGDLDSPLVMTLLGVLVLLTGRGPEGTTPDLLVGPGDASADADKVFAGLGGVGLPQQGSLHTPIGSGGPGVARLIDGLRVKGPGAAGGTGDKR